MPVIISLLYPRLFDRRGKKKRQNLDSTKSTEYIIKKIHLFIKS
jgi:hypothetical protein